MVDFLYNIIIYPLVIIIECIFSLANHIIKHQVGIAVLFVSAGVTLLSLPLYIVAEKWQETERLLQQKLSPTVKRIKATFSGDEQYMILTAFYKESRYHPLMALRSSISLAIMIPFFMAAYSYLSHLTMLNGESFLFIKDMAKADALFTIGGFNINVLPILMTLINCIAGAIYAKGHGAKEHIQLYLMALVFLVILYNSPSGLVLYWTGNNLLSLVKNIFYKLSHPLRVLYAILVAFVVATVCYVLFFHDGVLQRRFLMCGFTSLLLFCPFFVSKAKYLLTNKLQPIVKNNASRHSIFCLSCVALTLLLGLIIPGSVIASSVIEFYNIQDIFPLYFVLQTFVQCAGLFLVWPLLIYFMADKNMQSLIATFFAILLFSASCCTFCFTKSYGTLTRMIRFADSLAKTGTFLVIFNIVCCIALAIILVCLIAKNKQKIITGVLSIFVICFVAMGLSYSIKISRDTKTLASDSSLKTQETKIEPVLHLSKNGRNVVLLMLDRAESYFFNLAIKKDPTLIPKLSGFVYYPNTIAYGGHTIIGAPPIFGGYEYTPQEINKRKDKKQVEKHNESLLVLPRIFTEQSDFSATVCDSSWANYAWIPDMNIYKDYPKIKALTLANKYTNIWQNRNKDKVKQDSVYLAIKRNLLFLSFFRASPYILRDAIYDDGRWWTTNEDESDIEEFLMYYSVLAFLPELTDFSQSGDTFFSIVNETTHKSADLAPPTYEPYDLSKKPSKVYASSWCTYMAALIKVGKWFNYLRKNGVWDNTRVVIVADHGVGYAFDKLPDGYNRDHLHPLLLVKDFNSKKPLMTNYKFMTTADVPLLLTRGIIEEPVNPFTQKILTDKDKKAGAIVTTNSNWSPGQHETNSFKIKDDEWYIVKDYLMPSCWKRYTPPKN